MSELLVPNRMCPLSRPAITSLYRAVSSGFTFEIPQQFTRLQHPLRSLRTFRPTEPQYAAASKAWARQLRTCKDAVTCCSLTHVSSRHSQPGTGPWGDMAAHSMHSIPQKFQARCTAAAATQSEAANGSVQETPADAPRLVLLDAFAVLYKAHYAFGASMRLMNSSGEDTSVLYGFLSVLLALLESEPRPTHFAVVLDSGGGTWGAKTFRHEIYAGYKGQRQPMPEEIVMALPKLTELLELMGIPTFKSPGLEADDIIATLSMRGLQEGMRVVIASPDKDFFQLLRPGLEILRPGKPSGRLTQYTEDTFREEFGLEPNQFVDMLALCGDASDNVPGVKGIGPKTAAPLLAEHGDLESVLAAAGQIKKKMAREALSSEEGAAAARLSRRLVTLQTDVDVPIVRVPMEELKLKAPEDSGQAALKALGTLEFRQHSRRLQGLFASASS